MVLKADMSVFKCCRFYEIRREECKVEAISHLRLACNADPCESYSILTYCLLLLQHPTLVTLTPCACSETPYPVA